MNVRLRASMGLLAVAALVAGCPGNQGAGDGGDGGPGDAGPGLDGGRKDGGPGADGGDAGFDAGPPPCQSDSDCLSVGRRCAADGGCTLPAASCDPTQGSSNCSNTPYCWTMGISTTHACYCDPLPPGLDAGAGVCYLPIPTCGPCVNQIDCGPIPQVDSPAFCGPVGTEGNFCLPLDMTGSCPPAFVAGNLNGTDVCVPSCGTCPCSPCATDGDCPLPATGVCNTTNGACEPPCQVPTDCVAGKVCNVLGKYLDPTVGAYYAAGECGPACATAGDCTVYEGDAGLPYFCDTDAGAFCRPTACITDTECAQAGLSTGTVIAWCDIWDGNVCSASACRLGESALTEQPYTDCLGGYVCDLPDGGSASPPDGGPPILGTCFEVPCNSVSGGAHAVCKSGQLCCGEGDAGSCQGADAGACYEAPHPPWCVSCDPANGTTSNPACAGVNDGFPGAVACIKARGIGTIGSWCGPPCDPNEVWTCPSGWDCTQQGDAGYNCITRDGCLDAG